ncbi:hypothetical protein ACFY1U_47275 [Streptomyces sp. NPDC001351]|uniref:hypothetical protein n=1 Tax=Streptomyces sp. NPDC001351 TaxID=3364564 RepID=UPI0036CCAC54
MSQREAETSTPTPKPAPTPARSVPAPSPWRRPRGAVRCGPRSRCRPSSCSARVELDLQVLIDNPDLWYRLHEGARKSLALGTLLCAPDVLERISERVGRETAETVFRVSDLR